MECTVIVFVSFTVKIKGIVESIWNIGFQKKTGKMIRIFRLDSDGSN